MTDVYADSKAMYDRLRNGDVVIYYKCKKGRLLPYNTVPIKRTALFVQMRIVMGAFVLTRLSILNNN